MPDPDNLLLMDIKISPSDVILALKLKSNEERGPLVWTLLICPLTQVIKRRYLLCNNNAYPCASPPWAMITPFGSDDSTFPSRRIPRFAMLGDFS